MTASARDMHQRIIITRFKTIFVFFHKTLKTSANDIPGQRKPEPNCQAKKAAKKVKKGRSRGLSTLKNICKSVLLSKPKTTQSALSHLCANQKRNISHRLLKDEGAHLLEREAYKRKSLTIKRHK